MPTLRQAVIGTPGILAIFLAIYGIVWCDQDAAFGGMMGTISGVLLYAAINEDF